ncbi:MAG: tetratricopeptide repeat protein [Burkholderiaceae bacterium]|nr:tetratricopeptide repeat protein [Burkholderiaceae bacterium]
MLTWLKGIFAPKEANLNKSSITSNNSVVAPNKPTLFSNRERADNALKVGNLHEAERYFKAALDENPNDIGTCILLAYTLCEQGKNDEASVILEKALYLDSANVDALHMLGSIKFAESELNNAISIFKQILNLDPYFSQAYLDLSYALLRADKIDQSIEIIQNGILKLPEIAELHETLGNLFSSQGQNEAALESFYKAITLKPERPETYYNLGIALQAAKRSLEALESYDQALRYNPEYLLALLNRGLVLQALGRQAEALASYDKALQINSNFVDALNNRGTVLREMHRNEEAETSYQAALKIDPESTETLNNLGSLYEALHRESDALACYDQALKVNPVLTEVLNNKANILLRKSQYLDALFYYEKILAIDSTYENALSNKAFTLQLLHRYDESLVCYEKVLNIHPSNAVVLNNTALVLHELLRNTEALAFCDRALAIEPRYADALNNRGIILHELNRSNEALDALNAAIELSPSQADTLFNRANILQSLSRHKEAIQDFEIAVRIQPEFAKAQFNQSLSQLAIGNFQDGLRQYEWRWMCSPGIELKRNFSQPLWLGKMLLDKKTILIYAEQGLGDTIQFSRYAEQLCAMGAKVLLEVQAPLKSLMRHLNGVHEIFETGEQLPNFDVQCPLLSLPLAFSTAIDSIPTKSSYLKCDDKAIKIWTSRLANIHTSHPRIGVVWSGNVHHKNDKNRSIMFADFCQIFNSRYQFFSLQKELKSSDVELVLAQKNLHHFGDELSDFEQTAALIAQLDLVISVDTSVAHLAAAMGKPVWLLLPLNADWRWLENRSDSPWYSSMTLFRQSLSRDWQGVLSIIAQRLEHNEW